MYAAFKSAMASMTDDFCDDCGKLTEVCHLGLCSDCRPTVQVKTQEEETKQNKEEIEKEDVDEDIKQLWQRQQDELKRRNVLQDCHDWSKHRITTENQHQFPGMKPLEYIGGIDISFVKGDHVNACAALVVLKFPSLELVYEDLSMVELTAPYIPGYLAFREASFFVEKVEKLRKENSEFLPQVIMVDGNGILHPRRCGLATHLGIEVDIPCFGVAKNLFLIEGLPKTKENRKEFDTLKKAGDTEPLVTDSGEILGVAMKTNNKAPNPVFVSPGHKISMETCVWITKRTSRKRIPEPTRWADINSREYLRKHFLPPDPRQKKGQTNKQKYKKQLENTTEVPAHDSSKEENHKCESNQGQLNHEKQNFKQESDHGKSSKRDSEEKNNDNESSKTQTMQKSKEDASNKEPTRDPDNT